jgi:hypothetical protein
MSFAPVPVTAAWHHRGGRSGFEVVYFGARSDGWRIEGWTTAIEDGATWAVEYAIEVDAAWATRSARIRGRSVGGFSSALLEADGAGHWLVDGEPARHLDDCLDVERLEQSYLRTTDEASCQRSDYTAPVFGFTSRLVYDQVGLVLDYPGIAVRAG